MRTYRMKNFEVTYTRNDRVKGITTGKSRFLAIDREQAIDLLKSYAKSWGFFNNIIAIDQVQEVR